jgi:CheY-like chemotaxis protein
MKAWQVLAIAQRAQTSRSPGTHWTGHPDQEDLEAFALDKALPEDRLRIEQHLEQCEMCRSGYEEAHAFATRLQDVLRRQGREDQRRAVRYRVRESAIVTLCHPVESEPVIGEIMDVSASGMRIRLPRPIYRSSQVQVQVEKAVVFGTIRYSRSIADQKYDVGIATDQVVMPDEPRREQDGATGKRYIGKPALKPVEVLLIEDNPGDARLVELMFEELKATCRLTIASDGVQALARLLNPAQPKPNLVLLDLNLPRLSGLEVLKRIRQDRSTESVAVAVLSSSSAPADLQRTTALGIRAYLVKPTSISDCTELRTKLGALLTETIH